MQGAIEGERPGREVPLVSKIPYFAFVMVSEGKMIRYFKVAIQNHGVQSIASSCWDKIKRDLGLGNITAFGQKGLRAAFGNCAAVKN